MNEKNYYENSHLFVAAIRILEHRNSVSPSIEEICKELNFSLEQGNLISRKLVDIGCIDMVDGSYGTRLFIKDHTQLETLPKEQLGSKLDKELEQFQSSRKAISEKVEDFKAKQDAKKKDLFAELEKQLKKKVKGNTDNSEE